MRRLIRFTMRGYRAAWPLAAVLLIGACVTLLGCRTSLNSGLPPHIKTVEVQLFQNKTMYNSIEAWLTRDIIDRINMDPMVRLASRNGDAVITGEIVKVNRRTLRETTTNEPGTVLISIEAVFSFYDNVKQQYLVEDMPVKSTDTGLLGGLYEASRGGTQEQGERGAAKQLAGEIVRRTVGMW